MLPRDPPSVAGTTTRPSASSPVDVLTPTRGGKPAVPTGVYSPVSLSRRPLGFEGRHVNSFLLRQDNSTSFIDNKGVFIRDPIEVLERDEFGLIDECVTEDVLHWSDEDEEPSVSTAGDVTGGSSGSLYNEDYERYGHSPDSEDAYEMDTGKHVMDGVRKAHSARFNSQPEDSRNDGTAFVNTGGLRGKDRSNSSLQEYHPEDDQAAALLGQHSWSGYYSAQQRVSVPQGNGEPSSNVHNAVKEEHPRIVGSDSCRDDSYQHVASLSSLPFSIRNACLLKVIPRFYGVVEADGRVLLELEDLTRWYQHPCIMDIKIGFRTWYSHADASYIERCRQKDSATTQATLGFKICGMQVYRHARRGYWRASKRWCKTLPEVLVDKALTSFAHNEHGLRPVDVYGGPTGAVAQLRHLEAWFSHQVDFHFYSASLLLLYEGDAATAEEAGVRVRLVDFAHTFPATEEGEPVKDTNFLSGMRAFMSRCLAVGGHDITDAL